jgi:hypothetical protein
MSLMVPSGERADDDRRDVGPHGDDELDSLLREVDADLRSAEVGAPSTAGTPSDEDRVTVAAADGYWTLSRMPLTSLLVDDTPVPADLHGLAAVALLRRDELDAAVAVPEVVPVHK